jgi:hypothetical protein
MISRMRCGRKGYLFSLLFLISIFIIGFHHHGDGIQHSDCPVCMAGATYCCEVIQGCTIIAIHQDTEYIYSFEETFNITQSIFPTFAYRAPPGALTA